MNRIKSGRKDRKVGGRIRTGERNVQLSVVSIKVKGDWRIGEDVSYRRGVERKKEGTKDRTLRNTGREW